MDDEKFINKDNKGNYKGNDESDKELKDKSVNISIINLL